MKSYQITISDSFVLSSRGSLSNGCLKRHCVIDMRGQRLLLGQMVSRFFLINFFFLNRREFLSLGTC